MSSVTKFRSPHKVHILSWALALEKDGSVACHFKDCQFMALSIEEMGNHYPYCSCENSKFLFVCELCSRRTDTREKLLLHKLYTHSCKLSSEEIRMVTVYERIPVKKEITPILKRSWEIFLETRKYIKCLSRQCLYVTESIEIMEDHYVNWCKEAFWCQLKYQCEFCYGRVLNDFDLNSHVKSAHESKTYLMSNRIAPDSNLNCIEIWSNEILLNKLGRCFIEGCQFVDNNIKILEKHYASCNGKKKNYSVCSTCGSWLQNETRLNEHKRCLHKDFDGNDYGNFSFDFEKNSENQRSLLLDEMSPDESDSQYRIKNMKTEESTIEIPSEEEVPLWFFEPQHCVPAEKDILEVETVVTDSLNACRQTSSMGGHYLQAAIGVFGKMAKLQLQPEDDVLVLKMFADSSDYAPPKDPLALHPSTSNQDDSETVLNDNIYGSKKLTKELSSSSSSQSAMNEFHTKKILILNQGRFSLKKIKFEPYKTYKNQYFKKK